MSNSIHVTKLPKTSSEIINEAKAALNPPLYVKPLTTNRPFTPHERVFFCHRRTNRPPSAFKYVKIVGLVLVIHMIYVMGVFKIDYNIYCYKKRKKPLVQNYQLLINQNIVILIIVRCNTFLGNLLLFL
jgi:hypothetical protein